VRTIQELVAAVAGDDSMLQNLRFDPAGLARSLSLGPEHLAALRSAERFFASERPILDGPPTTPAPPPTGRALPRAILPVPPSAQALVATLDTGTLHTGPTTGTYTISSSAHFSDAVVVPGPPRPPPPTTPPSPGLPPSPRGPAVPSAPVTPLPPRPHPAPGAPVSPITPVSPAPGQPPVLSCPPSPGVPRPCGEPTTGPPELTLQASGPAAGHHACCHTAITAMVAQVGTTADTALVALTAIARQRRSSGGRHARSATS
jgi:hypothetical protein